jgi:hypothetical protein
VTLTVTRNVRLLFVSETGNLNDQLSFSRVQGSRTDAGITVKCIGTWPVPADNPDGLMKRSRASCRVPLVHSHFSGYRFNYSVRKFLGSVS